MTNRRLLRLSGPDTAEFLQGLVTNDVRRAPIYTALLSPQGKYLADFFIIPDGDGFLLDVPAEQADDLLRRLTMYKLRAKVDITEDLRGVTRGTGPAPEGAIADPRDPALGWRGYGLGADDATDWDAIRVAHLVPEAGLELIPNDSFILEMGFERLHGVDFRKGCYVGQEVTARMKHKTDLRKGLVRVQIKGAAPIGTEILSTEKPSGTLFTQSRGHAIAYLRFDRLDGPMMAEAAVITPA